MSRNRLISYATAIVVCMLSASIVNAETLTFDSAGDTAGWTTDRYAPQIFQSGVSGGGRNGVLQLGLLTAGQQADRPSPYNTPFYNYQGKSLALGIEAPAAVSVDMYVDSTWSAGARAGMWATNSNGNLSFPIIEYVVGTTDAGTGANPYTGFRYWQSNVGWTAVAGTFAADAWHNLSIQLAGNDVLFSLDGTQFATVSAQGAHRIDNVILQGHNQGIAGQYDIYFDNLHAAPVPLPPAALAGVGLIGLLAAKRRLGARAHT
jgi:hypothetical protein